MRNLLLVFIGMLSIVATQSFGGDNFRDNPDQVRWKFSPEMEVPHIAWAKPLEGKPVMATVVAPWHTYRDVVELCQRLSVTVNPLMTDGFNRIPMSDQYDCAYPDLGEKPAVWMALAQEQLHKPTDVIVIGKIPWRAFRVQLPAGGWELGKWDAFTVDLRAEVVDKVKAGCGLLYINPCLEKAANGEVCLYLPTGDLPPPEKGKELTTPPTGEKVVLQRVDLSDGPLRGMGGLKLPQLEGKEWSDIAYAGTLGKGRVLVLDYSCRIDFGNRTEEQFRQMTYQSDGFCAGAQHSLVGMANAKSMPCAYEYLMSCLAKGVLWCAGRDSQPMVRRLTVDAAKGIDVAVAGRPAGAELSVELRDASGEVGEVLKRWDKAEPHLALPNLKGGTYFVNAWLKNAQGEVLDWSSARLDLPQKKTVERRLEALTTRVVAPEPGAPVEGEVTLAGAWPIGDTLRLSVVDNFGRCLWRDEWAAPEGRVLFRASFDPGRSVAAALRAERLRNGEVEETLEKTLCFSTMELDGDFAFILWASAVYYDDRAARQNMALCRQLGVNALMHLPPELWDACHRDNMRLAQQVLRVTPGQVRGFSSPLNLEWWRNYFRQKAKALAPYAPLLLTFGDESCGEFPGTFLTPPHSDLDFRMYLGWTQDKVNGTLDLKALNQAWGTRFKTPEEITALPLEELKKRGARAQWIAESQWSEWTFQRLLRESMEAAWHEIPRAYYGDEGVGRVHGEWHDYYLLHQDMSTCQLYDSTRDLGPLFIKSFAAPKSLRGMWTGNYCYFNGNVDEEWMRSRPWRSLFFGMNSEWWWMLSLSVRPDGKPIPAFVQYAEEIARIKAGPATLLLKAARPSAPQVGVLYSPNTAHAYAFDHPDGGPHPESLGILCQGLTRAGYATKVLHPSQLDNAAELGTGYKALVLPAVSALSEKQAETIRRFVEQGGLLIADQAPRQYLTDMGLPYAKDPFRSFFAKGSGPGEYSFGKGKAMLLDEALSLNLLQRYKDVLGKTLCEQRNIPLPRLLREWIEGATGCAPPVGVALPDGSPLVDAEINTFEDGPARYVGIDRNGRYWEGEQCRWLKWDWYQDEVDATLTFPRDGHVYDVTRGVYIGQGRSVKAKLDSYPRLFASLPAKVEGLEIKGLRQSYRQGESVEAKLDVLREKGAKCASVVHVSISRDGKALPWAERNVVDPDGQGVFVLPLALDEAPGKYELVAKDVASGVKNSKVFEVRP